MRIIGALLALALLAGCGSASTGTAGPAPGTARSAPGTSGSAPAGTQRFPDVVDVEVDPQGGGYTVDATISSPYDGPDRYADAFRVRSPDGDTVYGVRELLHDHAAEQPFTRSLTGVELPPGTRVVVEARDLRNGWGGGTRTVTVPPRP